MKPCLFVLALLILLASGSWSAGASSDVNWPFEHPEQYPTRVLTFDDATSTSNCLGDPATPLCAIETVAACLWRGVPRLCAAVGYTRFDEAAARRAQQRAVRYLYKALDTSPRDRISDFERWERGWRDGDSVTAVYWAVCTPARCTPMDDYQPMYVTRREGDRWRVIDVFNYVGEDTSPYRPFGVITYDDKTSTSDCIGRPIGPLCAVETEIACVLRVDARLCNTVLDSLWQVDERQWRSVRRMPATFYEYTHSAPRILLAEDIPPWHRIDEPEPDPTGRHLAPWRAGDVIVKVWRRYCSTTTRPQCEKNWFFFPTTYITRRTDARWVIVDRYVPRR